VDDSVQYRLDQLLEASVAARRKWTSDDSEVLSGKVAVVTGANSGIGLETARGLARRQAEVVLACRDEQAGRRAAEQLASDIAGAAVSSAVVDLADLRSVVRFADRLLEQHDTLDILVNNAGVAGGSRRTTVDGFELHFGTNYLGHFALTARLMPALIASHRARVITVSSSVAAQGRIALDDLQSERRYRFVDAYAQSKLACLMFAVELDRRAKDNNLSLRSIAADPGIVRTALLRHDHGQPHRGRQPAELAVALAQRLLGQSPSRGALTSLYAATHAGLEGGEYIAPDGLGHKRGYPTTIKLPRRALDPDTAARIWEISSQLTGISPVAAPGQNASPGTDVNQDACRTKKAGW
jgi:NAD(P)-dependent dehydrogenase (short-subunit alcohol dehydrogenase family)